MQRDGDGDGDGGRGTGYLRWDEEGNNVIVWWHIQEQPAQDQRAPSVIDQLDVFEEKKAITVYQENFMHWVITQVGEVGRTTYIWSIDG